jgi:hypothetical protein
MGKVAGGFEDLGWNWDGKCSDGGCGVLNCLGAELPPNVGSCFLSNLDDWNLKLNVNFDKTS